MVSGTPCHDQKRPATKTAVEGIFVPPSPAPAPILGILWEDVVVSTKSQFATSVGRERGTSLSRCIEWSAYHGKDRMARYDIRKAFESAGFKQLLSSRSSVARLATLLGAEHFETLSGQYPNSNVEILTSRVLDIDWLDPSSLCDAGIARSAPATDNTH